MTKQGVVNIHGKEYKTVALRINEFRDQYPLFGIDTDVVCNAELVVIKAVIFDDDGRQVASGYAEEKRDSTQINKTSALENCETSAIGRALACLGFAGTEYASANEVANAIHQQKDGELLEYNAVVREHIFSIAAIKEGILNNNLESAFEAWAELTDDEKKALWKAPTRGGIFTTEERRIMKGDEWSATSKLHHETPTKQDDFIAEMDS